MKRFAIGIALAVLCAISGLAQRIPGSYVVELSENPLGGEVRTKGKSALTGRLAAIRAEQARVRPLIEQHRGQVLSSVESLMNGLIVNLPDGQAASIEALPGVVRVYPVYEYHADLDHAIPIHQAPAAWARIGGADKAGAGVKIAIVDTGITPDHPAFQDSSLKPPPGYPLASSPANRDLTTSKIIVARSYEDIYQEKTPDSARDRNGHGTAVASCAAGFLAKGPFAVIQGMAPKAFIGGYKIVQGNQGSASGAVILKALDDALADGMDVINLSFGSAVEFSPNSLSGVAVDRLSRYGVVFVTSAGNSGGSGATGSTRNTIGNYASTPRAISVGAVQNDRYFAGSVRVGNGTSYIAAPGSGPNSDSPITAVVQDITSLDPTGLACTPAAAGSLTGKIALILRGTCTFEQKLNDAQEGGAIAAIIYAAPSAPGLFSASAGAATLPLVTISNADGVALKAAVAANPTATTTIVFDGFSYSQPFNQLASFSSQGPNFDYTIKPDLSAVGTNVYMAAQSTDPNGELYSKSGYVSAAGTSFASPLTAGAVAVVRGARPGLTADQYRSLIVNAASPFQRNTDGWLERVQRTGTGLLNLDQALQNNIAVFPTSLSAGVGSGQLNDQEQLTLTNVGSATETFTLSSVLFYGAPPILFSADASFSRVNDTFSVTLAPGQSKTVYTFWGASGFLAPGEYQGQITITGDKSSTVANVPYWYGVPNLVPYDFFPVTGLPTSSPVGTTVNWFVRVTDFIGYAITDNTNLAFQSQVAAGGGSITLSNSVYYPNLRLIQFKLGPTAGANTYSFSFGKLGPFPVTITGTSSGSSPSGVQQVRLSGGPAPASNRPVVE